MDVVVIGAGAVGTCTAYRLARAGATVTLVGEDPAASLSAHSFAWVNPVITGSEAYRALGRAALDAHERLVAVVPGRPWFLRTGNLHWAGSSPEWERLRAAVEAYRTQGYPVRLATPAQAREWEPMVNLDGAVGSVAFYPRDAHVHADVLLTEVRRACQAAGVRLLTDRVVDLPDGSPGGSPDGSGAAGGRPRGRRGVRLASGTRLDADAVVVCAGRGTNDLLARVGAHVPLIEPDDPAALTRGVLVRTGPVPPEAAVHRVVHAPGLSIRPQAGGRLVLHSHDVDHTLPLPAEQAAQAVLDRLAAVLPTAARDVTVEDVHVGVRPMPRDGMSVLGWLPAAGPLYVVVSHSGLTLAPVLGEIAAQEVLGHPHPLATTLGPDRFACGR